VWNGSSWDTETVDTPSYGASWTSVALDPSGEARIAYVNGSSALLYARRNANGSYAIETAASSAAEVSLVLDASGLPHVSYYDTVAKTIVYAHRTGPGWASETVDSSDATYHANGLRLDTSNQPHLCYEKLLPSGYSFLGYAVRSTAGTWTKGGPSFPNNNPGGFCAIALDAQNRPHISHSTGLATYYSRLEGSTWINLAFDDAVLTGGFTSIAIDANGTPEISYFDFGTHQLRYARQK